MRALLLGLCLVVGCAPVLHGAPAPRPFEAAERSAWRGATRWGARGAMSPAIDRVAIGSGPLHLAFDDLPPDAARAILVLTPIGRGRAIAIVSRVSDGTELARVAIDGARPARIGLAVAPVVEIAIRAEGAIEVASPLHADPRARPRLELVLVPEPR